MTSIFRTDIGEAVYRQKYSHDGQYTWPELVSVLVGEVAKDHFHHTDRARLKEFITDFKFIPGGRYLYYAGRTSRFYNNCYLLRAEQDSREDWAMLSFKAEMALMTGGGIGVDYTVYRPKNSLLSSTGGLASGPIPKMMMVNEIGRRVMQGGSRRSAMYASLNWQHGDIAEFLVAKNWIDMPVPGTDTTLWDVKQLDFDFPAPLDMTNISVNYDNAWLLHPERDTHPTFIKNVEQALSTAEPGFSFNFFEKEDETLRNACTEVTSKDDSDVCNIGSINMANIETLEEFKEVIELATRFLLNGSMLADVPYPKVEHVKEKNRRLGLGLMGVHEWLLKRGYKYQENPELAIWLGTYRAYSRMAAYTYADKLGISRPVAIRAIAPTGTIGMLAGTTTGIEPLFAVAYKRRWLSRGGWNEDVVIEKTARDIVDKYGVDPDSIESSLDLAKDYERRIAFQAFVQGFVDQGISSTINLPAWGSEYNNPDTVPAFAKTLAHYAPRLRGFTCYPDGARGGQPLTAIPYSEAVRLQGQEKAHDICDISGKGGSCGA